MSDFSCDQHGSAASRLDGPDLDEPDLSASAEPARNKAVPAGSAVLRSIRILEAIAACQVPPQLAEICKAVDLPKPTVFRILSTLEHAGLVAREPGTKRYHCGPRMNRLAGDTLLASPSRAARRGILEELVEQVGETCNLTVPNGNWVMLLDRVEAGWPLKLSFGAGSSVPLHASASGKLFLAHTPRRSRERLVRQIPLVRHTHQTLTDPSRLSEELERVRQRGFATESEEYLGGIGCLAVPVLDTDGRIVAAIGLHAPVARLSVEQAVEFLPELQGAAEAIAQTLDW